MPILGQFRSIRAAASLTEFKRKLKPHLFNI